MIPHAPVASEICLQCTKSEGGKLCFGPHRVQSANSYCTNLKDPGIFGGPEEAGANLDNMVLSPNGLGVLCRHVNRARHSNTPGFASHDPRTCPRSRATPTFGRRRLSTNLFRRSTRARATPPSWEGEIVMLSKSYYNPEVSFITQAQSQHLPQHPVHREFQHQIRDGRDEPRGARRGRGARQLRSHQGLGHRGSGEKVKILMDQH